MSASGGASAASGGGGAARGTVVLLARLRCRAASFPALRFDALGGSGKTIGSARSSIISSPRRTHGGWPVRTSAPGI